ncbi:division/cell wall cluster transcriptional repressor MraZ [Planctomicrobium sp. SH668]|uniref:division/cell wall cluster transcriptional repressor MraZ n=1 Tax=Planctomicrobium sp. SH668 TaxID=3448126 RepID=UPI003F5C67DB
MALTGTHVRTLDDKSRLAVPKTFRDALCSESSELATIVVAPETEQALSLFSVSEFQRRADEVRCSAKNGQDARTFLRLYFSQAESLEIDKQGRVRLPERLIEFAGLQQEVVLLGVSDRVEIWDRSRWDRFMAEHVPSFDRIAQNY